MPDVSAPMRDVEGKVAFVTGGSSGIGLGIVRAFVAAGMKVGFSRQTESHLERAMSLLAGLEDDVLALEVDVTSREGMAHAAEGIPRRPASSSSKGFATTTSSSCPTQSSSKPCGIVQRFFSVPSL